MSRDCVNMTPEVTKHDGKKVGFKRLSDAIAKRRHIFTDASKSSYPPEIAQLRGAVFGYLLAGNRYSLASNQTFHGFNACQGLLKLSGVDQGLAGGY